jgi:galactose mutarotase-like enzyme
MSDQQSDWISLHSDHLTVEINPLGAQLSTLRDRAGRDLLWNGDPSVWSGRAPLLFPIVGELAGGTYRVGSTSYSLPRHGFARGRRFALVDSSATHAIFRLQSDVTTLEIYPFRFQLDVSFEVTGATLAIVSRVRNLGTGDLLASFGYHPAFRWPLPYGHPRSVHFIEFSRDEPAPIRRLNHAGLLAPQRDATPIARRRLELDDSLFRDDAIIFDEIQSRSVTYRAEDGPGIRVSYPDSPYLGIWSKPGAPFVCIEPWHGMADPDGFSGEFAAKPGVFTVAEGSERPITMEITVV